MWSAAVDGGSSSSTTGGSTIGPRSEFNLLTMSIDKSTCSSAPGPDGSVAVSCSLEDGP